MAQDAARELPTLTLEDAFKLVHLYAERGSPKYEKAALRWLARYVNENSPSLLSLRGLTRNLLVAWTDDMLVIGCRDGTRLPPQGPLGPSPPRPDEGAGASPLARPPFSSQGQRAGRRLIELAYGPPSLM